MYQQGWEGRISNPNKTRKPMGRQLQPKREKILRRTALHQISPPQVPAEIVHQYLCPHQLHRCNVDSNQVQSPQARLLKSADTLASVLLRRENTSLSLRVDHTIQRQLRKLAHNHCRLGGSHHLCHMEGVVAVEVENCMLLILNTPELRSRVVRTTLRRAGTDP